MPKNEPALLGGKPALSVVPPEYNPIGRAEEKAALRVLRGGHLSGFYGSWDPRFFGGDEIQSFEQEWAQSFAVKHAVSVNSNTSGLMAAVGALDIEPGDEIIVSPWTMSATATAILVWNAIPVFADIEERTFNLDPAAVEARITSRTKAILVTDIFGHAAKLNELRRIARRHGLYLIEDAAQAPGAFYRGKRVGTFGDIGVFSLNVHKHIHTGEGGICVTNNDKLALRMQLIRNHAESVVADMGEREINNMIGFNFRLTEIQAAIGREQLKRLDGILCRRNEIAAKLNAGLDGLAGLRTPLVERGCTHSYYVYPLVYDQERTGLRRATIVAALQQEGLAVSAGYWNLHLLPMYQQKIAYGRSGFPWNGIRKTAVSYKKGICPVAESMQTERYIGFGISRYAYRDRDINAVVAGFQKIWDNIDKLTAYERQSERK